MLMLSTVVITVHTGKRTWWREDGREKKKSRIWSFMAAVYTVHVYIHQNQFITTMLYCCSLNPLQVNPHCDLFRIFPVWHCPTHVYINMLQPSFALDFK